MKPSKQQFRIGKLAQELGVERFVIRFWEKEFGLKASRSPGGQRFYTKKDYETFKQIKQLLYQEGFTIAGAKKILSEKPQKKDTIKTKPAQRIDISSLDDDLSNQITLLQKKLIKLRELL